MALNPKYSSCAVNNKTNAQAVLLNSGFIDIYVTPQPAVADCATVATKLARLTFSSTAFATASCGIAIANAIIDDTSADATGTAVWFRALTSLGATVYDGSVGTSGADMNLNSIAIGVGAAVSCTSFTMSESRG